jgi:hypothetical protein
MIIFNKNIHYGLYMKQTIFVIWICIITSAFANAQNTTATATEESIASNTYGEFKAGYGVTQFSSGLKERYDNGNFSTSGGGLFSLAAYRTFENLNNVHFGLKFKGFGATPSNGDNGEEMFFNFWGASISIKYFPSSKSANEGVYLQSDYNFTTQFTQKYRKTKDLIFDHQFAIGNSMTFGFGYQYPLNNRYAMVTSIEYDLASRIGEVQGIGDKEFRNSNLSFQIGIIF